MKRIALVTGGNRGIGLEVCKQLAEQGITVVLGARDLTKGQIAVQKLKAAALESEIQAVQLDVANPESI